MKAIKQALVQIRTQRKHLLAVLAVHDRAISLLEEEPIKAERAVVRRKPRWSRAQRAKAAARMRSYWRAKRKSKR